MQPRPTRAVVSLGAAMIATLAQAVAADPAAAASRPAPPRPASCSISVPPVVISSGSAARTQVTRGPSCPLGSSATWSLVSPTGTEITKVTVSGTRPVTMRIPTASAAAFGRYRLVPVSGTDSEYGLMIVGPGSVNVKAGSRLSVATKGARVTAVATRYEAGSAAFTPWSRARVTLQTKSCSGSACRWTTLASARTDARGRAILTRPKTATGQLRVVTSPTSTVGGRTVALTR